MRSPGKQGYTALLNIKTEEEAAGDLMQAEISSAVSALERAYGIAMALGLEEDAADVFAALSALGRSPATVSAEAIPEVRAAKFKRAAKTT